MVLRSHPLPTLACVLASVLLAGCASASHGKQRDPAMPQAKPRPQPAVGAALGDTVSQSSGTFRIPQLTRKPGHVVRLHGTVPDELRARMLLHYRPTVEQVGCGAPGSLFGIGMFNRYQVTFEREIKPKRGRFETMIPIHPLEGPCQWRLDSVVVIVEGVSGVAKDHQELAHIVTMSMYDLSSTADACPVDQPRRRDCDEARQRRMFGWDDAVAIRMPCFMTRPLDGRAPDLQCGSDFDESYKVSHRVRRWTSDVRLNITFQHKEDVQ